MPWNKDGSRKTSAFYKMKGNPIERNFREWFRSTKLGQDLAGAREQIQSDMTELSGRVVKGFKGTKKVVKSTDTKKSKTPRDVVKRVEKELKSRDWTPRSVKGGTKAIRERAKKFQRK